jgi:hypothetical protein
MSVISRLLLALALALTLSYSATGKNRVTVSSVDVGRGGSVNIGILIENDVPVAGVIVPLVVKDVDGTASAKALALRFGGRLSTALSELRYTNQYPIADGTCREGGFRTIGHSDGDLHPVQAMPEGAYFAAHRTLSDVLWPGKDDPEAPSLIITVSAGTELGQFEIDTTCTDPTNHLLFITPDVQGILPEFVKGTVTVIDACCGLYDPHGRTGNVDGDPDGFKDISDILMLARFSLLGGQAPACLAEANTDGDPECFTDISDILRLARFALLGGEAPAFCLPECE